MQLHWYGFFIGLAIVAGWSIAEKIERVSPVTQQQLEHIFRGKGRMAQQVKWWLAWQRYCQSEISKQPAAD